MAIEFVKKLQKEKESVLFNLYEDEGIVYVLRKHWLAFVGNALIVLALLTLFFVGLLLAKGAIDNGADARAQSLQCDPTYSVTQNLGSGFMIVFGSMYILSVVAFFYIAWLDYYLDIFVLTNKRIIRFEQMILFGKKVSETSYQHVQDVSSKVNGFINTLFGVGTVFVETAGENENFSFDTMKDPSMIATDILELQKKMWDESGMKGDLHRKENEKESVEINIYNSDNETKVEVDKNTEAEEQKAPPELPIADERGWTPAILPEEIKEEKHRPVIEKEAVNNKDEGYKDGRMITDHGVIWQADQEINDDIKKTLENMDNGVSHEW